MPRENQSPPTVDAQSIQELFSETDVWIADLKFRSEELRFYRKITGRYLKSMDPETSDRVEQVQKQLLQVDIDTRNMHSEVLRYREHLDQQMKNISRTDQSFSEKDIREKHQAVQRKMHTLDREFRNFKDDVFDIAEDVFGD